MSKTYSFIYFNKRSKQQRENEYVEYVFVCFWYVTDMYSYAIRMSLVCTRMWSVCYSCVLVCHLYVTRMYSYVFGMSLVCTRMSSVCHSYVVLPWIKKNARNKSTYISIKHVQNVIKVKQNVLNNLFQYFSNFFYLSLGYLSIKFTLAFKAFEGRLVPIDAWHFPWIINGYWFFFLRHDNP